MRLVTHNKTFFVFYPSYSGNRISQYASSGLSQNTFLPTILAINLIYTHIILIRLFYPPKPILKITIKIPIPIGRTTIAIPIPSIQSCCIRLIRCIPVQRRSRERPYVHHAPPTPCIRVVLHVVIS